MDKRKSLRKCDFCEKSFSDENVLGLHLKSIHKSIIEGRKKCEFCDETFSNRSTKDLKNHVISIHEEKKFNCDDCNQSFSYRRSLINHVLQVHKNMKKIQCANCTKCFFNISNLKKHFLAIHEKVERINCSVCPKTFSKKIICTGI